MGGGGGGAGFNFHYFAKSCHQIAKQTILMSSIIGSEQHFAQTMIDIYDPMRHENKMYFFEKIDKKKEEKGGGGGGFLKILPSNCKANHSNVVCDGFRARFYTMIDIYVPVRHAIKKK